MVSSIAPGDAVNPEAVNARSVIVGATTTGGNQTGFTLTGGTMTALPAMAGGAMPVFGFEDSHFISVLTTKGACRKCLGRQP